MRDKWIKQLLDSNKELLLIFTIIAFAAVINFFVAGQRLVLTFYNLPTLFAAYYFGRARAVQTAIASVLIVCWLNLMNPGSLVTLASGINVEWRQLMGWSDIVVWAGLLMITAYATGTLYERKESGFRELRTTYNGVLEILSHFIANDKYTQHHSYRVSVYATKIGHCLGLSDETLEDIRAAALLHDIGKLDISREILYKAARLDPEEYEEIKTHVQKGIDKLQPVGGTLRRILPIVLAHHDKYNGTGYRSTKGEDIPIESRVISVADVFDSLVSDRPYRKGMSPFEARDIITKGAGTDFDPRVVHAFELAFTNRQMEVPEVLV
ncbi:MAG TPA: HD domain-containing phosphohydrolase [Candidatus Acidoferrales bacterium]|jgi:HD-GYP domain-containing protein (c-di-GMP phosphodiesterase class II)|nr:HD domain-containing phosphohydrolase [Candidatus Acidoferrales bacterium]